MSSIPPWSPELGSVAHVQRGARDPERAVPAEPAVVQQHQPHDLFAVRVEIIAGDPRRVVNAPPVYVAPIAARVAIQALELQRPPDALQLPAGEASSREASLREAPIDRPAEWPGRSVERLGAEARAIAAYGAQLELERHTPTDVLGQHVRVRV